jgi:cytochrome oxidase assembly protein ShyY1
MLRWGIAAAAATPFLGLGTWQSMRYFAKVERIQEEEAALAASPVDVAGVLDGSVRPAAARKVQGEFRMHHDRSAFVGPRPPPASMPSAMRGQLGSSDRLGFLLVTPISASASPSAFGLLVRGWVPHSVRDSAVRDGLGRLGELVDASQTPGSQWTLATRKEESLSSLAPGAGMQVDPTTRGTTFLQTAKVASLCGVPADSPLLEAVALAPGVAGWPFHRDIHSLHSHFVTPATHIGYAVTWYGLAIAAAAIVLRLRR